MRFLLVAFDAAPSNAFKLLEGELTNRGHEVTLIVGNGQRIDEGTFEDALKSIQDLRVDVILCGMSSNAERSECEIRLAQQALHCGTKVGFYADIYGCHKRPWFTNVVHQSHFLCVIDEQEAEDARERYPNTVVLVTGNPTWAAFFHPRLTRAESREKMAMGDDDIVILSPAGKTTPVIMHFWGEVIAAAHKLQAVLRDTKKVHVILARHPGDKTSVELYKPFIDLSRISVRLVNKDEIPLSDMIPGCDVLVAAYSTNGVEAACQRVPVIDYFTRLNMNEWNRLTGSSIWEPARKAASKVVTEDIGELAFSMKALAYPDGSNRMREDLITNQARVFPQTASSVTTMATLVIDHISKQ